MSTAIGELIFTVEFIVAFCVWDYNKSVYEGKAAERTASVHCPSPKAILEGKLKLAHRRL